jgi:hypothetical protein
MKKPYFPTTESSLANWLANFAAKLPTHANSLAISGADVAAAQDDCNYLRYLINDVLPQRRAEIHELTQYKDLIKNGPIGSALTPLPTMATLPPPPPVVYPGVITRLRGLIQRIKNHYNYTISIGQDLGIEGAEDISPLGVPTFKAIAMPNHEVRLEWKKGKSDGVLIESQRGNETTWTLLGVDHYSPYTDGREPLVPGQIEIRKYRMRYLDGDTPVSDWSDVVIVSTKG